MHNLPCLFNISLDVKQGGKEINSIRLIDDLIAGSKEELRELPELLDKTARSYGMDIKTQKSKVMVTLRNTEEEDKLTSR